jgi:dTDP-4-dehydrorhamnose 3,5-epimerase
MSTNKVSVIDGVRITQFKSVSDVRGTFVKLHPSRDLGNSLDSVALSFNPNLGTIRGLHFQVEPYAEEKLVSCVQGRVFDVIVDLRPSSQTFGKWTSFELSAENALQAYLPKGIAHGFQTLMPDTIVQYFLTSQYSPESSYSIAPLGDLGIDWPLKELSISEKDSQGVSLAYAAQKYAESIKG